MKYIIYLVESIPFKIGLIGIMIWCLGGFTDNVIIALLGMAVATTVNIYGIAEGYIELQRSKGGF